MCEILKLLLFILKGIRDMQHTNTNQNREASVVSRIKNGVLAASFLALQIISPIATIMIAANPSLARAAQAGPVANPALSQSCGLDIALVIDNSTSISNSEMNQMKNALTSFTNALSGTPTEFSVTRFATTATVIQPFTSNVGNVNTAINGVPTNGGYTNWQDGLIKASSTLPNRVNPNLIIFASDGDPTTSNGGGVDTDQPNAHLAPAVTQADAIKTAGTRILALGIGNPTVSRLQAISGPLVNTGNVTTSDVITSNFSTLAADLATFANQTCGGTITTTKLIDVDGNLNTTGDQTVASGWTFDINGSPSDPAATVTDANGKTPAVKVNDGTYSINETQQAGYSLLSAGCTGAANNGSKQGNAVTNVTVGTNNIISCTFINTPTRGSVQVTKKLDADGNGTYESGNSEAQANNMFWTLDGGATTTFGGTQTNILTGAHQVSEVMPAGYHFTGWYNTSNQDQSCANPAGTTLPINITVNANATTLVTLCNARDAGTIKIVKNVVNNNGGLALPNQFNMHLKNAGVDVAGSPVLGSNSGTTFAVPTGTYTVSEDAHVGYTQTSIVCSNPATQSVVANPVVLGLNQNITCVVTNDDIAPQFTLFKNVLNPYGNALPVSSFPLFIDGNSVTSGQSNTLDANVEHVISEVQQPGYNFTGATGNCTVESKVLLTVLELGEISSCTITNTAIQPKLIVKKVVINDNSGTSESSDFTLGVSGNSQVVSDFTGNAWGTSIGLNEGNYVVTENEHEGYTVSYSEDCTGAISIGQTKTCTVTNNDIETPSISVIKWGPATAHIGDTVYYDFQITNTGNTVLNDITISDDIAVNETCFDGITTLAPGATLYCSAEYEIPEGDYSDVVNHVTVTGTSPSEVVVNANDNHTLVILNPQIHVVKSGPATATAGSTVTYTFTVTNTGNTPLDYISVFDSITGEGIYVSGDTNGNEVLETTETWIFNDTYTIPANQVSSVVNTVEVCGQERYRQDTDEERDVLRSVTSRSSAASIIKLPRYCDTDTHTLTLTPTGVLSSASTSKPAVLAVTGQSLSSIVTVIAALSLTFATAIGYALYTKNPNKN